MSQRASPPGSPSLPPTLEHPSCGTLTPQFFPELQAGVLEIGSTGVGDIDAISTDEIPTQLDGTFELSGFHDLNDDVPAGQLSFGSGFGLSGTLPDDIFDSFRLTADDRLDLDTSRLEKESMQVDETSLGVTPKFTAARCALSLPEDQPKFFWETDPFLKTIFGQDDLTSPALKRPDIPIDITSVPADNVWDYLQRPKRRAAGGLCSEVIRHVELRDEQDKRASVISNWSSLVCIDLDAFSVGNALAVNPDGTTHADVESSLRACFARKATSTLSKRFYALNRFVNHCCRHGLQFFPIREHVVFTYLQQLNGDPATAPSAGRSLLEAVRFASGVLGLKGDIGELGTTRIDGLAVELTKRAGPIQQAAPLSVQQVMLLERLVAESEDLQDRVIFGGMLVLLYSCGRFSDGQRAINMILDCDLATLDTDAIECQGYLELQVLGHKGARSDILKRTFLPLVAPIFSLASVDWFRAWVHAREALGLTIGGKLNKPFLCRFRPSGEVMDQELTSAECSSLLRRALKLTGEQAASIKSHSLKTTALSWCCKHGVDIHARRLLGHHLDPSVKSPETYGRDSMAPAVRLFEGTLADIKSGRFRPDETRSGRFVKAAEEQPAATERDEEDDDSDSDYEPSSSDSDDSDEAPFGLPSESSLLWYLVMPDLRPGFLEVPDGTMVYRNNVSGVQHLKKAGGLKFMCGRRQNDRYSFYAGKPVKGVALCDHCMSSREVQAAGHE